MKTLLCLLAIVLGGCAGAPTRSAAPIVTEVKEAVAVPCKVTLPARPLLEVDSLPIGSSIWDQMRALRAERKTREGYEAELEAAAKACSD